MSHDGAVVPDVSPPQAPDRSIRLSVRAQRLLIFALTALAAAVAFWALIEGGDRDLWSNPAGFVQVAAQLHWS